MQPTGERYTVSRVYTTVRVIKSRWMEHTARTCKQAMRGKFWLANVKGKDHLTNQNTAERIILTLIYDKEDVTGSGMIPSYRFVPH
jgi:hypothetical protein